MIQIQPSAVRNRLLRAMQPQDFERLAPHLRPMTMQLRQSMVTPYQPITELVFPETGFVSITSDLGGNQIEIGLIGCEGLVAASPVLLGSDRSPFPHFVQAAGEALVIDKDDLCAAFDASASLRRILLRYVIALQVQTSQTAVVNAAYTIEIRLARWLLMCQDRLNEGDMALTHEFLSMMLGVQRTSVTMAIQALEGSGLIRARRGLIHVRDREKLLALVDAGYGLPESEYARLIEGA